MLQIVSKYITFLDELKDYIDSSPFKKSFIYQNLEMSKQVFYRKLKTKTFTANEVFTISKILFPSEALLMELEKSNADKKSGRIIEHSEAMKMLRKKHL
ncbi:hypothetical protein [uncultured Polaribacter sp.]|uniref:hypothetical protein n=1 Tax=uncultured Polaribacter sp. TaxID=174711 RepID=UPI0030DCA94E|tara:strand:- start:514 stop:810 length:297 start_codon:yes stop_codon:yes gene_type:complete